MKKNEVELSDYQQYIVNLLRISDVLSDSSNLDGTLMRLMQELLDIFQTDRAWLLYPCDPDSDYWSVPVEATTSNYPGAFSSGEQVPTDEGSASIFESALSTTHPVLYDFENVKQPPSVEKFSIKSQMVIALKPRDDKAWLLGMHQCSHHRKWSEDDQRLFSDIALKVTDMLTQRLLLKRLEEELVLRREIEQDLIRAKDEAESASKAKTEFLSVMSHELRTPMNAILGFSQLLEAEIQDEDQKSSVREIINAGNHLLGLINEVLNLSQIESGNLELSIENCNVKTIVGECISLSLPLASRNNISIINEINPDPDYVIKADYIRLKQILLNLVSNAIKYNTPDGKVFLACEEAEKGVVRIKVSDTGKGLTKDELRRLFTPFERLKQYYNVEGTGIGLVITKGLVEMMDGEIGVESRPDYGSTFWVQFKYIDQ